MNRRFQFSLRALLTAMLFIAAVAVVFGYLLRIPVEVPVTGILTLDGAPVSSAQVWFLQADGQGGGCSTDPAGGFATALLPGSYNVTVTMIVAVTPWRDAHTGELIDLTKSRIGPIQVTKSGVPERYGDVRTSGLTADVRAVGHNVFSFQLLTP